MLITLLEWMVIAGLATAAVHVLRYDPRSARRRPESAPPGASETYQAS